MTTNICYPKPLQKGDLIGVTAPSSGVGESLHPLLQQSRLALENRGFRVIEGPTIWTNDKCVSASKEQRAAELQQYLLDEQVNAVIPPWGGEFLMEILPLLDWNLLKSRPPKWILGYSDISTLTFAYTLLTGHASAHGTNYVDLHSSHWDATTSRWIDVLEMESGQSVEQQSSISYQSEWDFSKPGFQLDTPTEWKILGKEGDLSEELSFSGRLIGGCLDTISILLGTPFAPVKEFSEEFCRDTGMIWYLESCDMSAADIYRHLWQMKQCGWFDHTNGVLIGRLAGYSPTQNFELQDALHGIFDDLQIPVLYDADFGHVPPQITLVNGAVAELTSSAGAAKITMSFN